MSRKEQWKENAHLEKEKMKQMSFKDKIWYISEYYKFHIFGVFLAIGILGIIGNSIYRGTFNTELYVLYLNSRSDQELNTDLLTKDFYEHMGFTEKQEINTESMYVSYGQDATEFSYASMAKISALVASKDLDIMIQDTENFNHYAELSGCADLEQELPADLLILLKDRLCYANDDTGAKKAYGISLADTQFAEDSHLGMDPPIFTIVSNSMHKENSIALLRYIFVP
ncbi:MAG: hypothetical protein RSF83_01280 [Hungatella sp.]